MNLICAEKVQKSNFRPLKLPPIPEVKVVLGQFRGQCVPYQYQMSMAGFAKITRIDLEKSTNILFQTHFLRSSSFEIKFANKVPLSPLPLAMYLPIVIATTKRDWEKSAKMLFQTLKMTVIVLLTYRNAPAKLRWNNQKHLEKSE